MSNQTFQNPGNPPDRRTIPGAADVLGEYITPVLNDLWNTAPYLHDGSAHALLDVVRAVRPRRSRRPPPGRSWAATSGPSGTESHDDQPTHPAAAERPGRVPERAFTLSTRIGAPTSARGMRAR